MNASSLGGPTSDVLRVGDLEFERTPAAGASTP